MEQREIKFRGIDKISKEVVYGDLIHGVGPKAGKVYILPNKINLAYVKNCHPLDGVEVLPETVGQFTGLFDKNNVEIYDKDRIRFTINFSDENARAYWSEDCFVGEVYWKDYGWSVNNISFEKMYDQDYVFKMQDRDFDKRLLDRYSKIRACGFNEISNIEVIVEPRTFE